MQVSGSENPVNILLLERLLDQLLLRLDILVDRQARLLAAGHVVVGVAEPVDAAVVDQTGQKVEDYCLAHECSKAN